MVTYSDLKTIILDAAEKAGINRKKFERSYDGYMLEAGMSSSATNLTNKNLVIFLSNVINCINKEIVITTELDNVSSYAEIRKYLLAKQLQKCDMWKITGNTLSSVMNRMKDYWSDANLKDGIWSVMDDFSVKINVYPITQANTTTLKLIPKDSDELISNKNSMFDKLMENIAEIRVDDKKFKGIASAIESVCCCSSSRSSSSSSSSFITYMKL